ncbi:winged helix-turn-helix domain-containing protein [Halegenticoccus soli]|uniref:winged helix-turn-helix domain-containing protein n=1 Tax=Halegenticoccus soli TaxID=1985678 RepID=UPI000C6E57FC|nr:winged helix-turn-helix domain-containing protein [Halegenticoccus soli]
MGALRNDYDEEPAASDVLNALGDECSRVILSVAAKRAVTAKELTEHCDVSPATVYRRINTLLDDGLLAESFEFDADSTRQKVYRTTFEHVEVEITDDGFEVTPHQCSDGPYHLLQLLTEMPFKHINADAGEKELNVSIELTDDLFEQFVTLWSDEKRYSKP